MAGYQILSTLLKEDLDQLTEEGRLFDREEMASRIREAENDRDKLMRLYTEMCGLPVREDYVYTEPSEYEEIPFILWRRISCMISCTVPGSVVVPGAHWDSRLSSGLERRSATGAKRLMPGRLIITSPPTPALRRKAPN